MESEITVKSRKLTAFLRSVRLFGEVFAGRLKWPYFVDPTSEMIFTQFRANRVFMAFLAMCHLPVQICTE
jgi:hypothetical protein